MGKVYVVWHSDIEDDKYVRGVYATRELAEQVTTMVEGGDYPRVGHTYLGCCSVDEYEVATTLPETAYVLPEAPREPDPLMSRLLEMWAEQLAKPNPYRLIVGPPR